MSTAPRREEAPAVLLREATPPSLGDYLRGHLQICRFDHWIKNVFVLPGVVIAVALERPEIASVPQFLLNLLMGLLAVGFVASSNYTVNELLDASFDATHPKKRLRPVPRGHVVKSLAYAQWLALFALGLGISSIRGGHFTIALGVLWVMGLIYNVPPVRAKDVIYLDVLTEAINNPIRLAAGWYLVSSSVFLPANLVVSYWFLGAYFMTVKRYAEFRMLGSKDARAKYRRSFARYSEVSLLVSTMFYSSASMLFFGAFTIRYRMELILSYPLLAWVMATYLSLGFKADSAAQAPEKLWREPMLVIAVAVTAAVMGVVIFVELPTLRATFPQQLFGR